jgi:N-acetylmuramoyl-L-alanine amidase
MATTALGTVLLGLLLAGASGGNGPFFLRLVIPESDTLVTALSRYRFAGSTSADATVRLNGKPVRVYPSGAIAGLMDLEVGQNRFVFAATRAGGDTLQKTLTIFRLPPLESSVRDSLLLEDTLMTPGENLWLRAGDVLEVECKGTPGMRATFLGGLPMRELPTQETGGIEGFYRGIKRIGPGDSLVSAPVVFVLEDSLGHTVSRAAQGRLTTIERMLPIVGTTRGERPYLNAGLGTDRLGGAKLEFLVPGIRLSITGKTGDQYRVDLGEGMEAWIPEYLVSLEPEGTPPPFSLTGSWVVSGNDRTDLVEVALDQRLPWISRQESSPSRIVIDLYGAVSNTNWITHVGTAREVSAVHYEQVGSRTFRITIELAHPQIWGYAISYRGTTLEISVRRPPQEYTLRGLTVAVDAGHGGSNEGAEGSTGVLEKDINLATANHLRAILVKRGAGVLMTRVDDSFSTNSDRLRRVVESGADLLVSIHANSIGMASDPEAVRGASTYYRHPCYRRLAETVLEELRATGLRSFGSVGGFNFTLNAPTELPTVLVEQAFISNPEDEMLLLDDAFRREMAERIADGLERFLESSGD